MLLLNENLRAWEHVNVYLDCTPKQKDIIRIFQKQLCLNRMRADDESGISLRRGFLWCPRSIIIPSCKNHLQSYDLLLRFSIQEESEIVALVHFVLCRVCSYKCLLGDRLVLDRSFS